MKQVMCFISMTLRQGDIHKFHRWNMTKWKIFRFFLSHIKLLSKPKIIILSTKFQQKTVDRLEGRQTHTAFRVFSAMYKWYNAPTFLCTSLQFVHNNSCIVGTLPASSLSLFSCSNAVMKNSTSLDASGNIVSCCNKIVLFFTQRTYWHQTSMSKRQAYSQNSSVQHKTI